MLNAPSTLNPHLYPDVPAAEYERRHQLVKKAMGEWGVECLIVYGGYKELFQQNARWLTGCREGFQFYVVLPRLGQATVFSALGPHLLATKRMTSIRDVRPAGFSPAETVAKHVKELGLDKAPLGIVGVHSGRTVDLPRQQFATLQERLPVADFKFVTREFEDLTFEKSPTDLEFFRYGAKCTDEAMQALVDAVAPGKTETELYGELFAGGFRAGGITEFCLLGSTSMSDPDMPYPWHVPSLRKVGPGDIIQNEVSVAYGGCSGQLIVPITLGEPAAEYKELHGLAREAMRRIAGVLKPGNTEQEILEAGRLISDAGLTSKPLAHGWPNPPMRPFINLPAERDTTRSFTLRNNQIFMIEPNPTHPDGKLGLFLGALHVVTPEGGKCLQEFPLEIVVK